MRLAVSVSLHHKDGGWWVEVRRLPPHSTQNRFFVGPVLCAGSETERVLLQTRQVCFIRYRKGSFKGAFCSLGGI